MAAPEPPLSFSAVLDALSTWEGREVAVLVGGLDGMNHPIAIVRGSLGKAEMSDVESGNPRPWAAASYRVGDSAKIAIDARKFVFAEWLTPEELSVEVTERPYPDPALTRAHGRGCYLQIQCPPGDALSPGGLGEESV